MPSQQYAGLEKRLAEEHPRSRSSMHHGSLSKNIAFSDRNPSKCCSRAPQLPLFSVNGSDSHSWTGLWGRRREEEPGPPWGAEGTHNSLGCLLLDVPPSPAHRSMSIPTVIPWEGREQWELDAILLMEFLSTFSLPRISPERGEYLALT